VVFLTLRIKHFTPEALEASLKENLDLLEESRVEAHLKTLHYYQKVSDPGHSRRKLASRWVGPYHVVGGIRDETYTLAAMDGKILPRTWCVSNFKKFYV
ncbi:hypothetical protein B296_00033928, partial [Ensete ventricosum]